MLYCRHTILRACRRNGFSAFTSRIWATIALILLLPIIANAYTLVLRDGRWIEIPDRYQVTQTALTYEVTPGILVTLQLASIDIAATDKANSSPPGTLLRRVGREFEPQFPAAGKHPAHRAARNLTNLDLEQTRRKRIESETAYEIRRKELGLPSREESDKRRQEESARAKEMLAQSDIEQAESENYWRQRATSLRNEIYLLDSEINYVRERLAETGYSNSFGSYATFGGPVPFIYSTGRQPTPLVGVNQRPRSISQANAASVGTVGVPPRQQVFLNFSNSFGSIRNGRRFNSCRFARCFPSYGATYPYNYNSYDNSSLIVRFQELDLLSAGLQARWRLLEDEARRAGAQPGWLRP